MPGWRAALESLARLVLAAMAIGLVWIASLLMS